MTFQKPDTGYWERKLIAYLHDPLDKAIQILGHEKRSALFLEKYGLQKPNEELWRKADGIASGFERGQLPSHSPDENRKGSVDFLKNPVITHPTSKKDHLNILFDSSTNNTPDAEKISAALIQFIETDIGMKPGQGGYSDQFKNKEEDFAVARFLYTHLALRFRLSEKNVGGLGALWHRLPADTRFPDHSIWQHNGLCSALYSCGELSSDLKLNKTGLIAFSINPVQPFIAKARKLRDYWTGSVLLSWLAFEGIKWIIENLGPDHIIYPSLIDQPLINSYLRKRWSVKDVNFLNARNDIASFPNKFLFFAPMNLAVEITEEIKKHISSEWKSLYKKSSEYLCRTIGDLPEQAINNIHEIFSRQNSQFWEFQWAGAYLINKDNKTDIDQLLPESSFGNQFALLDLFNAIIQDKPHYDTSGKGVLYSVTHCLAQSALSASKTRKTVTRKPENGEKCHLCGEFEVLHDQKYEGDISAGDYKQHIMSFWEKLKKQWDGDETNPFSYDFNDNEKLCSVCFIKRAAYSVLMDTEDHILHDTFKGRKEFKSTTEMALNNYYKRKNIPENQKKEIAQRIHNKSEEEANNSDRYYAILMMDGDKMGKLVNGETLASSWKSIMHPEMFKRLTENPEFDKKYSDNWKKIFKDTPKRLLTPSIHAAISESLGDFSIYGVSSIIKKHEGILVYAGGDDVCSILPRETVFYAAREISEYYRSGFKLIQKEKPPHDVSGNWAVEPGKLSINLGVGDGISISAAILLCHHKESLSFMLKRAHRLLDEKAKKEAGRNACAVELRKRSGGSRYFVRRWDDPAWDAFVDIGAAIKSKNKVQVSSSVVYRLETFRDGIEAMLVKDDYKKLLDSFILKQLERSSVGNNPEEVAEKITEIVAFSDKNNKREFKPEGLIVAAFMAEGGEENE